MEQANNFKEPHEKLLLYDPDFWKHPEVWKLPDGSFLPTSSVILAAITLGLNISAIITGFNTVGMTAQQLIEMGATSVSDFHQIQVKLLNKTETGIFMMSIGAVNSFNFFVARAGLRLREIGQVIGKNTAQPSNVKLMLSSTNNPNDPTNLFLKHKSVSRFIEGVRQRHEKQ